MIDIKEIDQEIERLENMGCLNYSICNKLAMMYIIKDHFEKEGSGSIPMGINMNHVLDEPEPLKGDLK